MRADWQCPGWVAEPRVLPGHRTSDRHQDLRTCRGHAERQESHDSKQVGRKSAHARPLPGRYSPGEFPNEKPEYNLTSGALTWINRIDVLVGRPSWPNDRFGSPSDLPSLTRNVGSWGISGPQFRVSGGLLVAISRLLRLHSNNRILAHCDAAGGSNLQYHHPMAAKAQSLIPCGVGRDFKEIGIASSVEELTTV